MSTNITEYAEKSIFGKDRPECQNISSYPTASQFYEALNGYAIALYTVSCKWINQISFEFYTVPAYLGSSYKLSEMFQIISKKIYKLFGD